MSGTVLNSRLTDKRIANWVKDLRIERSRILCQQVDS